MVKVVSPSPSYPSDALQWIYLQISDQRERTLVEIDLSRRCCYCLDVYVGHLEFPITFSVTYASPIEESSPLNKEFFVNSSQSASFITSKTRLLSLRILRAQRGQENPESLPCSP